MDSLVGEILYEFHVFSLGEENKASGKFVWLKMKGLRGGTTFLF